MFKPYHGTRSSERIQNCAEEFYWDMSDRDPTTIVRDMLADLRHYCDKHKLCFGDLDKVAHSYYQDELQEDYPENYLETEDNDA
jgi:hypothetical protein